MGPKHVLAVLYQKRERRVVRRLDCLLNGGVNVMSRETTQSRGNGNI